MGFIALTANGMVTRVVADPPGEVKGLRGRHAIGTDPASRYRDETNLADKPCGYGRAATAEPLPNSREILRWRSVSMLT